VGLLAHGFLLNVGDSTNGAKEVLIMGGALVVTLLLAQTLHVWLEKPILKIGHRLRYIFSDQPAAALHPAPQEPLR
jgi:peptidoglycan/LPS O-acetylase OafA/YrhL